MKKTKKLFSWVLLIIAAVIIVEAAVMFIIISSPRSDLGIWLSSHDPLFNLLKSSAFRPPERALVPPTKAGSSARAPTVTRVPGKHFAVVPQGHPIFAKPDIDSTVLEKAKRKYKLEVLEEKDSWYRLEFPFGEGWVHPTVNARFLAGGAPFPLGKKTGAGGDSRGTMSAEIRFEADSGRRPDALYFEYAWERSRPVSFDELFEEGDSAELRPSAPPVDPERLQTAMKLLGPEAQSKRVGDFVLRYADAEWAAEAEPVVKNVKKTYQSVFKSLAVSGRKSQGAYIFLLPSLNAFKTFYPDAYTGLTLRTAGHYENGIITLHPNIGARGDRRRTLVHEAVHHYNNTILQINSVSTVSWLDEGLASYFGNCFIDRDGKLHLERIGDNRLAPSRTGLPGFRNNGSPEVRILMLQRELRTGYKIRIAELMALDEESFYASGLVTNYSSAWMLVHYLLHGKGESYRQGFLSYIARLRDEAVNPEQFAGMLGVTLDRMEDELRAYILSK